MGKTVQSFCLALNVLRNPIPKLWYSKIAYTAFQNTFTQLNSFTQGRCPQSSPAGSRIKCHAQVLPRKRGPPSPTYHLHTFLLFFPFYFDAFLWALYGPSDFLKCFCLCFHLLTNEPSHQRLHLLTVTSQTRAASPPSATKTCTTTRISGTCESLMAYITGTQNTRSEPLSVSKLAKYNNTQYVTVYIYLLCALWVLSALF